MGNRKFLALGALAAALVLAGCGGAAAANPRTAAGTSAANALVCKHYLAQRAWVKNLTYPTFADAVKFAGYVGADDGQAAPGTPLRRDLDAMVTAMQHHASEYAASLRVYHDCA